MATKNIKSVGKILGQSKEYWINAAKQFVWPIDFEQLHISVPHKDINMAENDLMVTHFRANGWHIQSAITVEYTKPFVAPVSDIPIFKPIDKKTEPDAEFKFNQKFRIKSTDCELKITSIDKKSIILAYTNRDKSDITTTPDNLAKSVRMGVWIKL